MPGHTGRQVCRGIELATTGEINVMHFINAFPQVQDITSKCEKTLARTFVFKTRKSAGLPVPVESVTRVRRKYFELWLMAAPLELGLR